jgi:hypothetical protein
LNPWFASILTGLIAMSEMAIRLFREITVEREGLVSETPREGTFNSGNRNVFLKAPGMCSP